MDSLERELKKLKKEGRCAEESKEHYGIAPRRTLFCSKDNGHGGKHGAVRNDHGLEVVEEWD